MPRGVPLVVVIATSDRLKPLTVSLNWNVTVDVAPTELPNAVPVTITVGATVSTGVSTTFCTFTVIVCVSIPPLPSDT
ncbi:hypothetical protein D3C72_1365090 [compost metagenome]